MKASGHFSHLPSDTEIIMTNTLVAGHRCSIHDVSSISIHFKYKYKTFERPIRLCLSFSQHCTQAKMSALPVGHITDRLMLLDLISSCEFHRPG